jgi:hypothetical protein
MSDQKRQRPGYIYCARCGQSKGKHSAVGSRCPIGDSFSLVDHFKLPRNHEELRQKLREDYA